MVNETEVWSMTPQVGHARDAVASVAHVFVPELGTTVEVDGPDGHHLARVRRLRVGERMTASTGDGYWRSYEIAAAQTKSLTLQAVGDVMVEAPVALHVSVAAALIPKARYDDALVAMVELGVDRVIPLASKRCVVRWDDGKAAAARSRLDTLAREASMQCRRSYLVEIDTLHTPSQLRDREGLTVAFFGGALDHPSAAAHDGRVIIATGPEGGFDEDDIDAFGSHVRLNLGPHVLRAETASVAAVAIARSPRVRS